ncbi:unnamed protein product [Linum tenue]|uniref:Uncharacterized protein n=1 Tax=Linum tenue TaxID=586396 RepID=A0AAV0L8B1_9ROSI|nr:unnamed protein product [Linum tenue]
MESKVKKETASSRSSSSKRMKLKLVIDKKKKKVILAEAQKDLVDFLIYLLTLPLSAVVKYLQAGADEQVLGSIGKLHGSVVSMTKEGYMKAPYSVCGHILVPQLYTIASILPKLRDDVTHPSEADYVMEKVQYMVADDLSVSPLDFNSVLAALKRCDDPGDVVEKEVEFGTSEALALLNASLHSKEALTAVFLKTEPPKVNV